MAAGLLTFSSCQLHLQSNNGDRDGENGTIRVRMVNRGLARELLFTSPHDRARRLGA